MLWTNMKSRNLENSAFCECVSRPRRDRPTAGDCLIAFGERTYTRYLRSIAIVVYNYSLGKVTGFLSFSRKGLFHGTST